MAHITIYLNAHVWTPRKPPDNGKPEIVGVLVRAWFARQPKTQNVVQ